MRSRLLALVLICGYPAIGQGQDTISHSFPSSRTRQEIISEATRLEGEIEAKYREIRRELATRGRERGSEKYEEMRRELVAKRRKREAEKIRRDGSEDSSRRRTVGFSRGVSQMGGSPGMP